METMSEQQLLTDTLCMIYCSGAVNLAIQL
jgi:hypothetical protein